MSVNPEEIINKIEFGTSRLNGRIEAINKLAEAGYIIGILIAPIILVDNWKMLYEELLKGNIDENKVRTLTRAGYVNNIKDFNSITNIANTLIECHIRNIDFFELTKLPNTISTEDIKNVLNILRQGIVSTHTVLPNKK